MSVIFLSDFCKMMWLCSIPLHVLSASITEEMRRKGSLNFASELNVLLLKHFDWIGSVGEELLERASVHALESQCQDTV